MWVAPVVTSDRKHLITNKRTVARPDNNAKTEWLESSVLALELL